MKKVKIGVIRVDYVDLVENKKFSKFYEEMKDALDDIKLYDNNGTATGIGYNIVPLRKTQEVIIDANLEKPGDFYIHEIASSGNLFVARFVVMNMMYSVLKYVLTAYEEHVNENEHYLTLLIHVDTGDIDPNQVITGTKIRMENAMYKNRLYISISINAYIDAFLNVICPDKAEKIIKAENIKYLGFKEKIKEDDKKPDQMVAEKEAAKNAGNISEDMKKNTSTEAAKK